ncbi:hypothetical protein M422DRAFT_50210 [Sphaerobolus stellatus SS14]|uniref:Uncharacterized protein n=1 Tax=Sphaerobolus stellatus (strain SS14) TaxID=990650 RepID=A0A0C9VJP5_SPHS4|nr:hypothetical protein M422DRAFT_50210 [Sphaerobolus stellatus SS14]
MNFNTSSTIDTAELTQTSVDPSMQALGEQGVITGNKSDEPHAMTQDCPTVSATTVACDITTDRASAPNNTNANVDPPVLTGDTDGKIGADGFWEPMRFLEARLGEYEKIEGPRGVGTAAYEATLAESRLEWKRDLAKSYMDHWPDFNYNSILPPNASQSQERAARNRVVTKIDNMLTRVCPKENGSDIVDLLFRTIRRMSAKNLWARSDPNCKQLEANVMQAEGYTDTMEHKEVFLLQMKVRKELFAAFLTTSKKSGVTRQRKRRKSAPVPVESTRTKLEFQQTVAHDLEGNVTDEINEVRHLLLKYLEYTYAMVPAAQTGRRETPKKPDSDDIATTEELHKWVELTRLPSPFEFGTPLLMRRPRLYELVKWIILGEMGKLEEIQQFKWVGQLEGVVDIPRRWQTGTKRKCSIAKSGADSEGEVIELDEAERGESDTSEAAAPKAKRVKGKTQTGSPNTDDMDCFSCLWVCCISESAGGSGCSHQGCPIKAAKPHAGTVGKHTAGDDSNASGDDSDSDSNDSNTDEAYVIRRKQPAAFDGDYLKWHQDFEKRRKALDWEGCPKGIMGDTILMATRFIEAAEGGFIDVTSPVDTDNTGVQLLFDAIMQTNIDVPSPSAYRGIKDWSGVYKNLLMRGQSALDKIVGYATDKSCSRLQVGGEMGIFPVLRGLEFMRRQITLRDANSPFHASLEELLDAYNLILPQEQFRRWAVGSFAVSSHSEKGKAYVRTGDVYPAWLVWMETVMRAHWTPDKWFDYKWRGARPALVKDIAIDAGQQSREVEPEHLIVRHCSTNWKRTSVIEDMKEWSTLEPGIIAERAKIFKDEGGKPKTVATEKAKQVINAEVNGETRKVIKAVHKKGESQSRDVDGAELAPADTQPFSSTPLRSRLKPASSRKRPPPSDRTTPAAIKNKLEAIIEDGGGR